MAAFFIFPLSTSRHVLLKEGSFCANKRKREGFLWFFRVRWRCEVNFYFKFMKAKKSICDWRRRRRRRMYNFILNLVHVDSSLCVSWTRRNSSTRFVVCFHTIGRILTFSKSGREFRVFISPPWLLVGPTGQSPARRRKLKRGGPLHPKAIWRPHGRTY